MRGEGWALALQRLLSGAATDPAAWMRANTRVLKSDSYSQVGIATVEEQACYLKFYKAKSGLQSALFRLGRSRALIAYDAAMHLAAAGVAVPEPRASLLVPGGMLLLTEGLSQATDLKALWLADPGGAAKVDLLSGAGQLLGQLHRSAFAHGDCKWSNLLVDNGGFHLVDLESVGRASNGDRRQLRDLARFTLNAEDLGVEPDLYECFVSAYLQQAGGSRDNLLAAVLPLLQPLRLRHRQKYGERGQPLL